MDELTFEEAYKRLEEVVRSLEADELSLDQSVELYELGMRLVRICGARLDSAQLRIEQLTSDEGEVRIVEAELEER